MPERRYYTENYGNKIQEVIERIVRLETKIDDFSNIRDKAECAYSISKENIKDTSDNKEDIKDINKKLEKITYATVVSLLAIVAFFIKITLFK